MKLWKRIGAALISVLVLTTVLTGTVLAVEPAPGGIGVQLNGAPLTFTDAAPEITGGRTFLPFRAVLEAMGAEVGFDEQTSTVSARRDGITLSMVPGQKQLTVIEDGQTRTVEMDVAPYIKESNGRTYVPVRFVAEALGYNVGWDPDQATVILVDVDALFGGATFDLLDSFAAYCDKQNVPENMAVSGNLNLEIQDQTMSAPIKAVGSLNGVVGDKGAQLTGKLDLSGLEALLDVSNGSPMDQAIMQAILSTLSSMTAELRVDLETETLSVLLPVELTGEENTWYSMDLGAYKAELLGALDATQLSQLEGASIRDSLVWVMQSIPLDDTDMSYTALSEMAALYVNMLGDQSFTQQGSTYVSQQTLEDIVSLNITLTKRGDSIVAMDLTVSASETSEEGSAALTLTEHASPDKVTVQMSMSLQDGEMNFKLDMDLACVPTQKTPDTLPPDGALIIPLA